MSQPKRLGAPARTAAAAQRAADASGREGAGRRRRGGAGGRAGPRSGRTTRRGRRAQSRNGGARARCATASPRDGDIPADGAGHQLRPARERRGVHPPRRPHGALPGRSGRAHGAVRLAAPSARSTSAEPLLDAASPLPEYAGDEEARRSPLRRARRRGAARSPRARCATSRRQGRRRRRLWAAGGDARPAREPPVRAAGRRRRDFKNRRRGVSRIFDRDLERECTTESASFVVGYLLGMPAMAYAPNVERSLSLVDAQAADPVA